MAFLTMGAGPFLDVAGHHSRTLSATCYHGQTFAFLSSSEENPSLACRWPSWENPSDFFDTQVALRGQVAGLRFSLILSGHCGYLDYLQICCEVQAFVVNCAYRYQEQIRVVELDFLQWVHIRLEARSAAVVQWLAP